MNIKDKINLLLESDSSDRVKRIIGGLASNTGVNMGYMGAGGLIGAGIGRLASGGSDTGTIVGAGIGSTIGQLGAAAHNIVRYDAHLQDKKLNNSLKDKMCTSGNKEYCHDPNNERSELKKVGVMLKPHERHYTEPVLGHISNLVSGIGSFYGSQNKNIQKENEELQSKMNTK